VRARVRRHLDIALPPLARKAGRERLDEVAARVSKVGTDSLATAMARALSDLGRERATAHRASRVDGQVLRAAVAAGASRAALMDALERYGQGPALAGDLRALDRHLDASAIEDRMALAVHEKDQLWAFTAHGLARVELAEVDDALVEEIARSASDVLADRTAAWWVRTAAVAALASVAHDLLRGARARQALLNAAQSREDDAWVVSGALEAYLDLPEPRRSAQSLLSPWWDEAGHPRGRDEDGLFVRARVVRLAVAHDCHHLARMALEKDPSEHVRMCAARALAVDPKGRRDRERVVEMLEGRAGHWRVAAAAAIALIDHAERDPEADLTRLTAALSETTPERVLHVVLDAVWVRLRAGRWSSEVAVSLRWEWEPRLAEVAARPGLGADVLRLVEVLRTWCRVDAHAPSREAFERVGAWLAEAHEGDECLYADGPVAGLSGDQLLDVLFLLAHDELDLSALPLGDPRCLADGDRVPPGGYRVFLGTRPRRELWRFMHEVSHPRHDKRSAHPHLVDEVPPGPLVAWSARLSEVVATMVPGRRVSSPARLDWHEHLPLVVNLLVAAEHGGVRLRTPGGVVQIAPEAPDALLRAHRAYVRLADLRQRLTETSRGEAVVSWDHALKEEGFAVQRHTYAAGAPFLAWLQYLSSADLHATTELGILSGVSALYWGATKVAREAQLRAWRAKVPFIVGGWGSRGKSSVERLKGALFQGLGYTVLCNSTGCEAMILLGMPGSRPVEVFLYRPNDKATIVEQANVLRLAARMRPQVVLWECMALNPVYTGILQKEWMRDDLTTITNTYPDHEDIQGPAGRDVADVIAQITPYGGELVTSEQHMRPVLARRARDRDSGFTAARLEEWELLPDDVLARFPYEAHRRNVTLVTRVASVLGVPADVAWRTMADGVLPDLGAFKTYGPADVDGRELTFVNGCSANDRASFLSNWERKDLEHFDASSGLGDRLVVVVNNRADRPARQAMFARIVALDVSADHVSVIGTNVVPMGEAIRESLRTELRPRLLDMAAGQGGRPALAAELARRLRRRPLDADERAAALAAAPDGVRTSEAARIWEREVAWLHDLHQRDDWDVAEAVDRMIEAFAARFILLEDPKLTGDQVLFDLAHALPEGTRGTLLGCSNIKGTGLDFVYRWVGIERVKGMVAALSGRHVTAIRAGLEELAGYTEYGLVDARMAHAVVAEGVESGRFADLGLAADAEALLSHLEVHESGRAAALADRSRAGPSWFARLGKVWKHVAVWKAVWRRRVADRLYRDLADRRVGAARAAEIAQKLVAAEKG
jgi:poly-gamma-glutamate synthase PgsB/CapB